MVVTKKNFCMILDNSTQVAVSYGWFYILKVVEGFLVMNVGKYSKATSEHQKLVALAMYDADLYPIRIDNPEFNLGEATLEDVLNELQKEHNKLTVIKDGNSRVLSMHDCKQVNALTYWINEIQKQKEVHIES